MEDRETIRKIYTNILKFMERVNLSGNESFAYIEAYKYISNLLVQLDKDTECLSKDGQQ